MSEDTTTTSATEPQQNASVPAEVAKELEALRRHNADLLGQVKKLKGATDDAVAKALDPIAARERDLRAQLSVVRALNSENIYIKDTVADGVIAAILKGPGVKIGDDGSVDGVGDAIRAYREAGLFGGIPQPARPEASPAMAKPKSTSEPVDQKYASVNTKRDLIAMGAAAFTEFSTKYPDRYAALR